MTREPDRFEEKARQIVDVTIDCMNGKMDHAECVSVEDHIAAALRAEHDDALERAAQLFEEDAKQSEANAGSAWNHGESDSVVDHLRREARICHSDAARIRALASPAAAPAAEHHLGDGCLGQLSADHMAKIPAPPSEPAAQEKEIANLLGRGHVRNPREGEPGDAETYSSPAPLLPRVLAVVNADAKHSGDPALIYLAAELRAYIAEREKEPELRRLLAQARTIVNAHLLLTDPNEAPANAVIRRLLARIDAAIRRSP